MIKLLQTVVEEIIKVAVETEEDKKRITQLESALYEKYKFDRIIGKSEALQNIFKLLGKVIESESPVLIEGETGTGKETSGQDGSLQRSAKRRAVECGKL